MKRFIAALAVLAWGIVASAAEKSVVWELPANWSDAVSYPAVEGYRAIVGENLMARGGTGAAVGDPDVPYYRVRLAFPTGGTFKGLTADVTWEPVDLGGALPIPVMQPVPTSEEPTLPAPGAAYKALYPSAPAIAGPIERVDGTAYVPVIVSPFKWEGSEQRLYRATKLVVTATFDVVTVRRAAFAATTGSCPANEQPAYYNDDHTADVIILSPPKFKDLWVKYAQFRATSVNGQGHTFAIKTTDDIYEDYADVGGDDAFKIHRYLEHLYNKGNGAIKYIILGSAPKKYNYDPETMVPSRYIVVGSSLGQVSDEYYACMDRNPINSSGVEQGVEVWDYDGDGTYMGHKNANGSYSCDTADKIDWTQEIGVMRVPLMEECVETKTGSNIVLNATQIIDNFIAKIKMAEDPNFIGRGGACLAGATAFSSSTYSHPRRSELYTAVVDERMFFDGALNMFDPRHSSFACDAELVPRDRNWQFLSYLRGNNDDNVVMYNSSYSKSSYQDQYTHFGDQYNALSHGWARGAVGSGGTTDMIFASGLYIVYTCPIPCDTGMMDYCPGGSYGITNCVCMGEAPVLAPAGGAIASFNNTRLGWTASFAMSGNAGKTGGQHSHRMDWLLINAMSGAWEKMGIDWSGKYPSGPMNAADALRFAKNNFNAGYYASAAWGLSGLEVTGQGDPFAMYSKEYARTWTGASNSNWNTTDKNWTLAGETDAVAADYSTDLYVDLTGKGSVTNNVTANLASAGLFVKQDVGATWTLTGDMKYRATRETVITNGNVRWEVAGGAGRNGIAFVGERGNIELPGDRPRYFGEKFTNVGDIKVTGGNVVIDTPRSAAYGVGKNVDFTNLCFVASEEDKALATNNIFRTRTASFLPDTFTIPVVNSELILQVIDNPIIAATNATITVQNNPLYENCYFAKPIYLNDSTFVGDCLDTSSSGYGCFALGNSAGEGFDLYVKGACKIAGEKAIKLNGELRIHFEDAESSLEITNPLADGVVAGSLSFIGEGKIKLSGAQTFTTPLTIGEGVTLECTVADAIASSLTIADGGTLKLDVIPLTGLTNLTVQAGGSLHLPAPTYTGTYKIVDATTTTLDIQEGATVYDENGKVISGEQTQGHYVLAANQLVWQASEGIWNLSEDNTTAWKTASGVAAPYTDNSPLKFPDLGGDVTVKVGENVAPGFVDFKNTTGSYIFNAAADSVPTITFNSLVLSTPVAFNVPASVPGGIMSTAGSSQFADIVTPKTEIANGATLRATGTVQIPSDRMKKLRFEFSATRTDGNRAAVNELRLFNAAGRFYLPKGTVIRDIAGETVTVTGNSKGDDGQETTGDVGDEKLSALIDGDSNSGNKWWASKSASPTWFEITFPTSVVAVTGYSLRTADVQGRDPKDWKVYAGFDDDRVSLVATETGRSQNSRHQWYQSGASVADRFPISGSMAGLTRVRAGGALALDGMWYSDLELSDGAILKVVDSENLTVKSGTLYLPDSGTVTIDVSAADEVSTAFPILVGYNITAEQFNKFTCAAEDAMLLLKDGNVYAATANVMVPPYSATVSVNGTWGGLTFSDKNGSTFSWTNANIKADGTVTLTVNAASTITLDAVGTIANLTIKGSGALTVNAPASGTPLAPAVLDDSAHTGALVWNCPIGSTAVTAGSATTIGGGSEGTGMLTVDAGKSVTLGDGVTFANRTIDPTASIRFAGTRADFTLADWPAATYSFENGTLVGDFVLEGYTIKSAAGDYVKLVGSEDNFYARSLLNFNITGGTVEIEPNGSTTWFGRSGTTDGAAATTFTQSGGTFRFLGTGTAAGDGILLGYDGGNESGNEMILNISGGVFEVPDSFVEFGTLVTVNLENTGRMSASGYAASISAGTINLGTQNYYGAQSRLEVGSLGFQSGAAVMTMTAGTGIVGVDSESVLSGSITLYGSRASKLDDVFIVAATNGTHLILRDASFEHQLGDTGDFFNGNEPVTFGNASVDATGEVVLESASSFPKRWYLKAGTLNVGTVRAQASSTLVEKPADGCKIITEVTQREFKSGASVELLCCGDWANNLSSDELRAFISVLVQQTTGELVEDTEGTLRCESGIVEFIPSGAVGYVFPISATVSSDANWTALEWYDRKGQKYVNDWTGVISAELVCSNGSYAVTMDRAVSMEKLTTRVASGATLALNQSSSGTLELTDKLDDSASAGTTKLQFTLGEGLTVSAGKALQIKGAEDTTTTHGKLIIGANSQVTVLDGYWNGEVEMADSTSVLDYESTNKLTTIPSAKNSTSVGKIEYAAPLSPADGKAEFGSSGGSAVSGTYWFNAGTDMTVDRFATGVGNGTEQLFRHYGGTFTVNGSDEDALVIGDGLGSKVRYYLWGGDFIAPNAVMRLGPNGKSQFNLYSEKSTCRVKGITTGDQDNNSSMTLMPYTTLEIGSEGINIKSSVYSENIQFRPIILFGATIKSTADATISVPNGIGVGYPNYGSFAPAAGTTLTVDAPIYLNYRNTTTTYTYCSLYIDGEGTTFLKQKCNLDYFTRLNKGTLRLAQRGLLGTTQVQFNGGSIEVCITRAEAEKIGASYQLFRTTANTTTASAKTTAIIAETGAKASGNVTVSGGYAYFTPTTPDLTATIAGATGAWEEQGWKYSTGGSADSSVWGTIINKATLTNSGTSELTFSSLAKLTTLNIANSGTLTVSGSGTMEVAGTLDDSASTGRTELGSFLTVSNVVAGADTVLAKTGSGSLTIAAGKCATIPSWDLTTISGAGCVALDAGSKNAAITWSKSANVTGTNIIARGTWTIGNNSTYPTDREVLVKGTNAVMKLTSGDATGYGGSSKALTLENGGTWMINSRDTFSRPLYLVNGGHVKMSADDCGASRALDVFTTYAKIYVRGETPSTIGGQAADETSTTASGIVDIRRSDFTIDVDEGSTLRVYSEWGTEAGNGGSFYKTGAGVLEQYRASSSALPFVISAGTLRLVNGGTVTTGNITNNGTLEVLVSEGNSATFPNTVSGTATILKTGAGTLDYGTTRLPAYTIDLKAGKLGFKLTEDEFAAENWVALCMLANGEAFSTEDNLTVLEPDGSAAAITAKVENNVVMVKPAIYHMPITLTVSTPLAACDWVDAPWKESDGASVTADQWEALLKRSDLKLAVDARWDATLNVNTNVTAQDLALTSTTDHALILVMDGEHKLNAPITGTGNLVFTGKAESSDFAQLQLDHMTVGAKAVTNANAWVILEDYTLEIAAGALPVFTGDVAIEKGATLKVTGSSGTTIPVSEKTLTIDENATLAVNGIVRPSWSYSVAGGTITLESIVYSANVTKDTAWANGAGEGLADHGNWLNDAAATITLTNGTTSAAVTFDTDTTAAKLSVVNAADQTLTLGKTESAAVAIGSYDLTAAEGTVVFRYAPSAYTMGDETTFVYDYTVGGFANMASNYQYHAGSDALAVNVTDSKELNLTGGEFPLTGLDVETGTLNISGDAHVTTPKLRLGNNYKVTSTVNQTGGILEVTGTAVPTNTSADALFAHWDSTVNYNFTGGELIVTNTTIRYGWDGVPTMTVNGGTMTVKGIRAGYERSTTANFTLAKGTLNLGSGGLLSNNGNAKWYFNGGTVVACEDSSINISAGTFSIGGDTAFAAKTGKTLTVSGALTGTGTIDCSHDAENTGSVVFTNATLTTVTLAGSFTYWLSAAQSEAILDVVICKANGLDTAKVSVFKADGTQVPNSRLVVKDGSLVVEGATYTMPLTSTMVAGKAWAEQEWIDAAQTVVPARFWTDATNATVVVTLEDDAEVTVPSIVSALEVSGSGTLVSDGRWPTYVTGLTDDAWTGTLRISNMSGCSGNTGKCTFDDLGNTNSTVEMNGVSGWFNTMSAITATPFLGKEYAYTIKIGANGFTVGDGSSSSGFSFAKLTGSGTLSFGKAAGNPTMRMVVKNATGFTGKIAVVGNAGLTVGTPASNPEDGKLVIASGATANISPTNVWTAVNGIVFQSGSTLNVLADGSADEYTVTTSSLTLPTDANLTFNGTAATRSDWIVVGGKLVKPTALTSHTVNAAESYLGLRATSAATLTFEGEGVITTTEGLVANASVTIDASSLDGTNIAKNAVCGAPYSRWLVKGPVSGSIEVANLPAMPAGYSVKAETLADYGVRLVVTARDEVKLGAVSLNIGAALTASDDKSGLYGVVRSEWGNLTVSANNSTTVSNVTFTIGSSASGYSISTPIDPIQTQYMDDSVGVTRTVTMSGITYPKYRVIVYFSTDTANWPFRPVVLNGTSYAANKTSATGGGATIKDATVTWGHSGPDKSANALCEGVNALVSDVMTDETVTLSVMRASGVNARATVAAIQIVEVGELYTGPFEEKTIATTLSYRLPGTETMQDFTYVYHPTATDASDWRQASNWAKPEVKITTDGYTVVTNYTTLSDIIPGVSGGSNDACYLPLVIDGQAVTASAVDGWQTRYGFYNGAKVTIESQGKYQIVSSGVQMFMAVDATSQLTVKGFGTGNCDGTVNLHVAAPSGIVYTVAYDRTTDINYYLEGNGSVCYEQGFSTGTHTLKACTIELGDASLRGKAVMRKYLVVGTGATVSTNGLVVTAIASDGGAQGAARPTAVTTADDVGCYCVTNDTVGTYIEWVAYASGVIEVHPSETSEVIETTDTNLIHVVSYYTNGTEEVKLDLTSAFVMSNVTGGVQLYLNPAGKVEVKTVSGVETNSVMPVLSVIADDTQVAASPFVVDETAGVAVGVKSIPGLTYQLMRRQDASSTGNDERVDEETAKGPRVKLTDNTEGRPSDKAFYIIRVTR